MSQESDPVVVYVGASLEASVVKSLLEAKGIQAFLKDDLMATLEPYLYKCKVIVAKRDLDRAKRIVQEFLDGRSSG